jgi:hypothetical protein
LAVVYTLQFIMMRWFRFNSFSLRNETKRNEIRLACVSLLEAKTKNIFRFFSLPIFRYK